MLKGVGFEKRVPTGRLLESSGWRRNTAAPEQARDYARPIGRVQ
jgi:hypothetical protein